MNAFLSRRSRALHSDHQRKGDRVPRLYIALALAVFLALAFIAGIHKIMAAVIG
jgi:hypothetical protein